MIRFSEIPYRRPDMEALTSAVREAALKVKAAKSYAEVRDAYFAVQDMERDADTMYTVCHVRNTVNTADAFYDGEMKWLREAFARTIPVFKAWQEALAGSAFRGDFEAEYGAQLFRKIDAAIRTGDEKIIPETIREGELRQAYQKETALASADFRGERCNFYGLLKHMQSTDRRERKEAFEAWAGLYERISGTLEGQYAGMVALRDAMAKKMGFGTYTEMAYLSRGRFDYTQEDAARFREQVRKTITPAVAEIRESQRKRLGVDRLRYYDEGLKFPEGNAVPDGTADELVAKALRMYREMSPETGEFFGFMTEYGMFDLETKPGKRMGGYMTRLPAYRAPFIFSNFNGTEADVDVLTHEAGHAFQGYLAMRSIPVDALCGSTSAVDPGGRALRIDVRNQRDSFHVHGTLRISVDGPLLWRKQGKVHYGAPDRRAVRDSVPGVRGRIPARGIRKAGHDARGLAENLAGYRKEIHALAGLRRQRVPGERRFLDAEAAYFPVSVLLYRIRAGADLRVPVLRPYEGGPESRLGGLSPAVPRGRNKRVL